jgi:hypothetical protein
MSKTGDLEARVENLETTLELVLEQVLFAEREPRHMSVVLGRVQILCEDTLERMITVDPNATAA